jgi:lipoprotein-anchoring transpeptidase ErfK/SrfK
MRIQTFLASAMAPLTLASVLFGQTPPSRSTAAKAAQRAQSGEASSATSPAPQPCADPLALQVLLDRRGYSPGQIDGTLGTNTKRALAAFRAGDAGQTNGATAPAGGPPAASTPADAPSPSPSPAPSADAAPTPVPTNGTADSAGDDLCQAFTALGGGQTEITTTYTITSADAEGLLTAKIPTELRDQASLPNLGYTSLLEKVAEKFHAAPALVTRLNKGTAIKAGAAITVPNVTPFDVKARPAKSADPTSVTLEVTKEGIARVIGADGRTMFFAPVSSGSEHDPLPIGQWKVNAVSWMPAFHYNPDLFWDAKATDQKATIKPGPNNPVGVVWIDISVEHYGLHGTPEPSRIGYTQSHGCVRLTNWDAARLASLVGPGTPVVFK